MIEGEKRRQARFTIISQIFYIFSVAYLELKACMSDVSFKEVAVSYLAYICCISSFILILPSQVQLGLSVTHLGRIVKEIKSHSKYEQTVTPPETSVQAIMDKVSLINGLASELKIKIKRLAVE